MLSTCTSNKTSSGLHENQNLARSFGKLHFSSTLGWRSFELALIQSTVKWAMGIFDHACPSGKWLLKSACQQKHLLAPDYWTHFFFNPETTCYVVHYCVCDGGLSAHRCHSNCLHICHSGRTAKHACRATARVWVGSPDGPPTAGCTQYQQLKATVQEERMYRFRRNFSSCSESDQIRLLYIMLFLHGALQLCKLHSTVAQSQLILQADPIAALSIHV